MDVDGESVFSLLATVREFALDRLRSSGEERGRRGDRTRMSTSSSPAGEGRGLGFGEQTDAVARLNLERGNLRAAVRHLVAAGDVETAADMAWRLYLYWWVGGYLTEVAGVDGGAARLGSRERCRAEPAGSPRSTSRGATCG